MVMRIEFILKYYETAVYYKTRDSVQSNILRRSKTFYSLQNV